MSDSTDPARIDLTGGVHEAHHEIRRRGRIFGLEYDLGLRVTELCDPGNDPSLPTRSSGQRRLSLPAVRESVDAPAFEGIGRWESEGGR